VNDDFPEVAAFIREGIAQAEAGQTADRGSFAQYADDLPPEAITAAQAYDVEHRVGDQGYFRRWTRVPDEQVARLLEGGAPLIVSHRETTTAAAITRAERERIRQLAIQHAATYAPAGCACPEHRKPFADVIGGDT